MSEAKTESAKKGLEGAIAGVTRITLIDGMQGRLLYRGYRIQDLATNCTFEEIVYLLWNGELPNRSQLAKITADLRDVRSIPPRLVSILKEIPANAPPIDVLRSGISLLAHFDKETPDNSPEANWRKSLRLVAQAATITAAHYRIQHGHEPVEPNKDLSHAANFLYMLTGTKPDPAVVAPVEAYFVLLGDHDFNASTFAGRVTVGTMSDIYAAATTSLGTLKGPLHGGAAEAVMEMLPHIKGPNDAEAFVDRTLAAGQKVMGFGHRVYKTRDPRGTVLKEIYFKNVKTDEQKTWGEICQRIERRMLEKKNLNFNVDFYGAVALAVAGIPIELFTNLFGISRMAGYCAHFMEQYADNRLIRPLSDYQGPAERDFLPLEKRK